MIANSKDTDRTFSSVKAATTEQLPAWMRRARQSVDWGILITLFFSALAAWPFILQADLPRHYSAENHVFAAAEIAESLREGVLYTRWSPSAALGYGAPLYNYSPPALRYLAGIIDVLFTDGDAVLALRAVLAGAMMLAGAMVYVLVLRISGAQSAILASLLYVYSPYIGLTAPHLIGDYPAVLTFALYPAALWSVTRLFAFRNPMDMVTGALIAAGFLLTDPLAGGVGLALCIPLLIWHRSGVRWREWGVGLARLALAVGLGVGLAAFFWWPALAERHLVTWIEFDAVIAPLTLTLAELLRPVGRIDLLEMVVSPQLRLGWPLIVAVGGAVILLIWRARGWGISARVMWHGLFLLTGILILAAALVAAPDAVWLLGPAALCLAVGGSLVGDLRRAINPRWERVVLPSLVVWVLIASLPVWLGGRPAASFGETGIHARILHEQAGFGVAVMPTGQNVPLTATVPIIPNRDLIDGYRRGEPIRVPNLRPTGEKRANFLSTSSYRDRYVIDVRQEAVFDVLRAYDPAWRATLNGRPLEVAPNPANGLIQIRTSSVTGGELDIAYGTTPARQTGWLISGVTLLGLAMLIVRAARLDDNPERYDDMSYIPVTDARLMGLVCGGFLLMILIYTPADSPTSLHAPPGHSIADYSEFYAQTGDGFQVIAYRRTPDRRIFRAGEAFDLTLVWSATRPQAANYQVEVFLIEIGGFLDWVRTPPRHPGGFSLRRWEAGYFLRDTFHLRLDRVPPGLYDVGVRVALCVPECLPETRQPFFDADGQPLGETLLLPFTIDIRP